MKYIINILLAVLLMSCCAVNKLTKKEQKMLHNKWVLSLSNGAFTETNPPVYIELTKENKVYGFLGCNRLSGTYEVKGRKRIKFNSLATTRMACDEGTMRIENKILELLRKTDNFVLKEEKLMLYDEHMTLLAIGLSTRESSIVNKYWKLKQLNGKTVEMSANQEREQYFMLRNDGTFSGFAGCNHFTGTYTLGDKDTITFNEDLAATLKICPDIAVDEQDFFQLFQGVRSYSINGDTLIIHNESGTFDSVFEAVYF